MTPDPTKLPAHVAIIMDGNGRWARQRGKPVKFGHRRGAEVARSVVEACIERNIPYLTLFAFSSENWMRPNAEVDGLMALFLSVLKRNEINQFHQKGVRFNFIGKRDCLAPRLLRSMDEVKGLTEHNTGTTVTVAVDYGGRWDITEAAVALGRQVEAGQIRSSDIDAESLRAQTSLGRFPDPDLCIRTGGEKRISNFLLWQFAYTEFYFADCYWPEFTEAEFQRALEEFANRQRRFGTTQDKGAGDE
jgi:undecaprenyl diphosphate synthase